MASQAIPLQPVYPVTHTTAGIKPDRIRSIDLVRGIAMILMAIDHVRVYSGIPAGGQTFGLFFTRWITNFVAPTFVFLAGTSAYLYGQRCSRLSQLSRFLLIRGVWLIFLELTLLRICWTFNFDFADYMLAGVIWMIGWGMIILATLAYLPSRAVASIGVAVIALENLSDVFQVPLEHWFGSDGPNWLLKLLYFGGEVKLFNSGPPLLILYVLVPWVATMMVGYGFGAAMKMPRDRRARLSIWLGAAALLLFVLLRLTDRYGDPRHWHKIPTVFSFLNATKYPASLDFLLMTLGAMFICLGLAEYWKGPLARIVEMFGRVPMFYYLLHIPLIHLAACVVSKIREGRVDPWLFANHPLAAGHAPPGYRWSLGLLYLVYAICVVALYFPCRWYAARRAAGPRWLTFLYGSGTRDLARVLRPNAWSAECSPAKFSCCALLCSNRCSALTFFCCSEREGAE